MPGEVFCCFNFSFWKKFFCQSTDCPILGRVDFQQDAAAPGFLLADLFQQRSMMEWDLLPPNSAKRGSYLMLDSLSCFFER